MASSAVRWGALVASSLVSLQPSGCAPTPPPEPVHAPAPAPSPEPPAPPPPAPPRLSPLAFVMPAPTGGAEVPSRSGRVSKNTLRYGRGEFSLRTYARWGDGPMVCPLLRESGCSSFSISTTGKSPDEKAWLASGASVPLDQPVTQHGPLPAPQDWVDFAPGKDVVYALRRGGKAIDVIDDQGKVSTFAADEAMNKWSDLWITEVQGRVLVAGQQGYGGDWQMAEALPPEGTAARKLGPLTRLPMAPLSEFRPNAQGARSASRANGMAMFGTPHIVALPDEGESKSVWAMVWLETAPPPYGWPAGKPYKTPAPKKGAKHGCGGPPSRGLDDRSVEKRAHITRFAGARLLEDTVAWATNDLDPYPFKLQYQVDGGKISVDKPAKAKPSRDPSSASHARRRYADNEPLLLSVDEDVMAIAFDEASGEGAVLVRLAQDKAALRRFDAEARLVGEPAIYSHDLPYRVQTLARVGKSWVALGDGEKGFLNLTADQAPVPAPQMHHELLDLFTEGGQAQLLSFREDNFWLTPIDEQGKATGEPTKIASSPPNLWGNRFFVQHVKGSPPMVAALTDHRDFEHTSAQVAWMWARPGATWTTTAVKASGNEGVRAYDIVIRRVHGDLVAIHSPNGEGSFTWLGAGKSVPHAKGSLDSLGLEQSVGGASGSLLAPMLHGEEHEPTPSATASSDLRRLPATPGEPVVEAGLDKLNGACSHVLPTGPTTTVLACSQAADASVPGVRVGLRVLRHAAP